MNYINEDKNYMTDEERIKYLEESIRELKKEKEYLNKEKWRLKEENKKLKEKLNKREQWVYRYFWNDGEQDIYEEVKLTQKSKTIRVTDEDNRIILEKGEDGKRHSYWGGNVVLC